MAITVETVVAAPLEAVWRAWTTPTAIVEWNAASDDWHTTSATVDLREGGAWTARMEAKDGHAGFDFGGRYTDVVPRVRLGSILDDGRSVLVAFDIVDGGVRVRETFDTEGSHTAEEQRAGWQAILDRFARYVASET